MKKIVIIGGGIVGLAIGRELIRKGHKDIEIIEKEKDIALHQSARNSGVMHAGLYYSPGSLKANLSRKGINMMKSYCTKNDIPWEECGKVVIANEPNQLNSLGELFQRGTKNGLLGLERLNKRQINNKEPYVDALEGLLVPEESIVNYRDVAKKYYQEITCGNGLVHLSSEVNHIKNNKNGVKKIFLKNGEILNADIIIIASGLYTDKLTNLVGIDIENKQILPFRGEYYLLKKEYDYLVKGLIYPVPNPQLPFLGVHFTKMIDGNVEAGPNAVLALAREGYSWRIINPMELYESIKYPGLRKFILKYPLVTIGEVARSLSKQIFVNSLKKLIPCIESNMLTRGSAGIRAQLMNQTGDLIQDFDIRVDGDFISILNAPSPAATSSLAIAEYVVKYIGL